MHKRFLQLGALEKYPRGEADEQHEEGLDASFVPWANTLRSHLLSDFPLRDGYVPIPEYTLLEPKWLLCEAIRYSNGLSHNEPNRDAIRHQFDDGRNRIEHGTNGLHTFSGPSVKSHNRSFAVEVQENRRVTPASHWQDVRHFKLSSQTSVPYGPGDILTVYPLNGPEIVNEIISMMDWTSMADKAIEFVPTVNKPADVLYPPPPVTVPEDQNFTLRYLLTNHLDLTAIPRRSFFSMIANFTSEQSHKDRLLEFTDPKYVDELYDYTTRSRRSILEVLQEFDTVKIPWQWAASLFPELRGRQFSIASGGHLKASANGYARFELLVAIVQYKTVIKKVREGVCSKYLAGLKPGDRIFVTLHKGGLGITKAGFHTPVIMIGPGTGIAPLRSLIWERILWKQCSLDPSQADHDRNTILDASMGSNLLFFGCRNENADYFFKDEWDKLRFEGSLQVHSAFSRDQVRKHYVQDAIREHSSIVYDMLRFKGAIVYVCGSSGKMPIAVRAALVDVIQQCGRLPDSSPMSEDAALRYMEAIEKEGRYKQETW